LEGLAVDSQGNLYDSDISNSIIRKFNQNGNQLLVFGEEGVGSGQFGTPSGIALDSHGNIWVADSNNRIQKFDHNGNFLLAFGSAGNGPSQFNFPRGLAIDSLDNLYVADTNNHRIQKFDNNGNYITTISKGGVPFSYVRIPFDVAVDSDNNVWVADTGNNRIQKFSSDGAYLATYGTYGNDTGQFSRPRGVFVGPDNEIYVTDTYNNRIQVFDENLNSLVSFGRFGGLPSQFGNPNDIVYSNDKMFVTDSANDRIQSFDDSGEFLSEFRIRPSPMEPYFTYFDQAENILVSDGHLHRILTFDPSTGALLTKFGVAGTDTGEFRGPRGMVQNSAGEIFVSDNYNNRVQKFSASGEFLLSFGSSGTGPGQFDQPRGIVIDSSGNVLVADSLNNRIQKFEQDGGFISQFSSYQPYQVNLDSSGNIYSAEGISGKVEKFDSNGNSLKVFSPFNVARGVCLDSSDNIYVVEEGMGDVRKLDPQGNLLAIIGSGGTGEGQFNAARTCQIDSNGHLWVADTGNARVQEFDANGFFVRAITLLDNSSLDFVPPVLSLPPTTYGQASNSSGGIVNYLASATDNVDGALTPLCTPESGSFFPIGATTVDCSVTDASGNSAMGSFSVNVVNIAITSVSNASPKWGTTSVAISGNTAGIAGPGVTTYHVQIDWGDGAQSGSLAVSPAGNWGPTAHTYGSGALATNPNKIVAKLQITSSSVTIAESPFSAVNVQKHTTTVTLGSIPNVQWGKPISLSATLKDADAQSSVISAMPITFDGTGVVIGTNATTNGTGIAKVTISSPSSVGTWTARAHFAGTDLYLPSDSTTRNYNTVKHGVSLALSIMPTSVVHDGTYIVRGQLRDLATGTLLPGQTISFIATSPIVISPTATDSDGLYTVSGLIAPSTPGAYNIQASYAGTSLYNSAVSPQKTLTVT
jgi:streptogramin lyase